MALEPSIAMGYRGIEVPNQMAQYAQLAQLQSAQNQNALAQYQLGAAQRAEAKDIARTNALAQAGTDDVAIGNALLRAGDLKGYADFLKTRRETLKADVDLVDAKLKQSRAFLENVTTPEQYLAWHEANHRDPVLGPALAARGITADQSRARIMSELQTPGGFQTLLNQSKLGTEKFMELNKPHYVTENLGSTSKVTALPGLGGAPTDISTTARTATPGELLVNARALERNALERQRLAQDATGVVYQEDAQGNIVALPSKLKKGEVPTARVAVAPGGELQPLTAKPSEAVGKEQMSINQQKSIVKGAIDAVNTTPDAFNWYMGNTPESLRARIATSDENEARAFVFNVVSGVIKERAGTAQSAGEQATLRRFLPDEGDNAQIIKDKLEGFQKYLAAKETGTTKKKPSTAPGRELSTIDRSALEWANANPNDPRAAQIKQRLGVQ